MSAPTPPDTSASISIVIPTRGRPEYLEVALASIAGQAEAIGAEVLVVDDGGESQAGRAQAERYGARYEPHPRGLGLNVARNTGVERSSGELVVFVDDDVEARPGWLGALARAAREHPEAQVLTGPIRARLEGSGPRSCGREGPPITSLDLGAEDTDRVRYAWGANMAVRRAALERVGMFDVRLEHGGDEQEWQDRLLAEQRGAGNGRPLLYVAGAAVDHRRVGKDARLRALTRAARARGRAARRFDAWRGQAPPIGRELRVLAGCVGHVVRYRCAAGVVMVGHSAGRLEAALARREGPMRREAQARREGPVGREALARREVLAQQADTRRPGLPDATSVGAEDFLSGASGTVGGVDGVRRAVVDVVREGREVASGRRGRLRRAARRAPARRRVLVVGVVRPEHEALAEAMRAELGRSRHQVELHTSSAGEAGKFENLNRLLKEHPAEGHDWVLVIDDDVVLGRGFLDSFLFLAERFGLDLAQPAHRAYSHAAWEVTRRAPRSVVRETRFVEIGPVTAFAATTYQTLLPFPELRMGWGLDLHWGALARARGWRCGVVDAVAIRHSVAPAAQAYSREAAVAEARAFLAGRAYVSASEAGRTLTTHRSW